jgi:hypothetical protein
MLLLNLCNINLLLREHRHSSLRGSTEFVNVLVIHPPCAWRCRRALCAALAVLVLGAANGLAILAFVRLVDARSVPLFIIGLSSSSKACTNMSLLC